MRRSGLAAAIACGLLVVACSEQPTEPGERTPLAPPKPAFSAACSSPTTTCIQTLINALFPQGDLLRSANSFWANIQTKVNQGSKGRAQAQAKAAELVNFGLKNFQANKLIGGMGTTTQDNLISLNTNVLTYTGLTDPPSLPPEAFEEDGAAAVLTPQSPTTLVITGTEQAGVLVPAGAAPEVTVVSIRRLPDSPGPLLTSLDQFPLFYEFASSPEVTFTKLVTTGVCQLADDFNPTIYSRLRLAHNVSPFEFGDIEILPRVDAPFLDCSNTGGEGPGPIGTLEYMGLTGLAYSGWNFMGRAVGRVARAVFLPDELHAAMLGTCCLGGSASKFSPFGAVDPASNPGGFSPVGPTTTTEEGGSTVTRTVLVTSQNGTPIAKVPVTFATEDGTLETPQPVDTDQFGNATVSWILPPDAGVYTLTAEVTEEDNAPAGPGTPTGNVAFTPDVAFDQTSLTFTAVVLAEPPFGFETGEAAWTATGFWNRNTFIELSNSAFPQFVSTFVEGVEGDEPGGALPSPLVGSFAGWYGQASAGNYLGTQAAEDGDLSGGTSQAPNSGAFLSPPFRVPDVVGAEVTFQTWWEIEGVNPANFDLMEIVVLDLAGTELGLVRLNPAADPPGSGNDAPFTSGGFNTAPTWEQVAIDVSEHRGEIIRLRLDFNTIDHQYNGFRGWIVDQIHVGAFEGPSLRRGPGSQGRVRLVPADRATFPPRTERP